MGGALHGSPCAAKGAIHGSVGGAFSVAQGGEFIQGFAANALGAIGDRLGGDLFAGEGAGHVIGRTTVATVAGGAGSAITGGKFANGAAAAAIGHLFNQEGGDIRGLLQPRRISLLSEEGVEGGLTIRDCVGKSDGYLLFKVRPREIPNWFQIGKALHSTFPSLQAANRLVNSTIHSRWLEIVEFLTGNNPRPNMPYADGHSKAFSKVLPTITGRAALQRSAIGTPHARLISVTGVTVLIRKLPH